MFHSYIVNCTFVDFSYSNARDVNSGQLSRFDINVCGRYPIGEYIHGREVN
jgi:hypothetical protein